MSIKEDRLEPIGSRRAHQQELMTRDALDQAIDETIQRWFMRHDPPARAYARILETTRHSSAARFDGIAIRSWIIGVSSTAAAMLLINLAFQLGVATAQLGVDTAGQRGLLLLWLSSTDFARWVNESETIFGYSGILFLHTLGLAIVAGASVVVNLRVLGAASRISVTAMRPLFRYMWLGFCLSALSGAMLFAADAPRKAANPLFEFKLALIAIAVAVMAMMDRRLLQAESGTQLAGSNPRLKGLAIASLLIWAAAIAAGRLVAYAF
jgi:hypothetical protein